MEFHLCPHPDTKQTLMINRVTAILAFCLISIFSKAQLPDQWTADYVISISHTGSMSGGSTHIKFTYDKCEYKYSSGRAKPEEFSFSLTEEMRNEILNMLRETKVDKLESRPGIHAVNDGWAQAIVLGTQYIEGGTSVDMTHEEKNTFLTAYGYLEEYAMLNKPKSGKRRK